LPAFSKNQPFVNTSGLVDLVAIVCKDSDYQSPDYKRADYGLARKAKMLLNDLFELFMKERTFIRNASPLSIKSNKHTWLRWTKCMGNRSLGELNRSLLVEFVFKLRELPIAPTTCNITIREINSFLSWLHENDYTKDHLKMKQLKTEKTVTEDFSDE